jgi:predicted enzyme related to lactoylglutathione lyase
MGEPLDIDRVARTILFVRDMDLALAFYRDVLGLAPAYDPTPEWAELSAKPIALCLHGGRASDRPTDDLCIVYFRVDDFDAACERLRGAGVRVAVHETPHGVRLAIFHDPDGNALGLEGS